MPREYWNSTPANFEYWLKKDRWGLRDACSVVTGHEPMEIGKHQGISPQAREIYDLAYSCRGASLTVEGEPWSWDGIEVDPVEFMAWVYDKGYDLPDELMKYMEDLADQEEREREGALPKSWEDLSLRFFDGLTLVVAVEGCKPYRVSAKELGFEDRQTSHPTVAWKVLQLLAKNGGILASRDQIDHRSLNRTHVHGLRSGLKDFFELDEDPLPIDNKDHKWKARFSIVPEPKDENED
jgi:hypothetical protein